MGLLLCFGTRDSCPCF